MRERNMKRLRLAGTISASLFFASLLIYGCAASDPELNRMLSGAPYSAGWVGIDVAYKSHVLSASHTIVSVAEDTPASRAGLVVGDEIWFIGSCNALYIQTPEVARRLRESDPQVVIKVKRKGQKDLLAFLVTQGGTRSARRSELPQGSAVGASSAQVQAPLNGTEVGPHILPYTTDWGFKVKHAPVSGMLVLQVTPGFPADGGGLKADDVILALDGVAMKDFREFDRPPYVPVKFLVRRQGAEIERTVLPHGIRRLKVIDLKEEFSIPGVPAPENPATVSAIDALDCINVLDRVVLDPKSGQIAVIGHYDKAYDTGRIPYLDLLKTALANPSPILNLAPTPDTRKEILATEDKVRSNLELMVEAVRGHPDFERERQLMIRELAKLYGLTPEEYVEWYNYVKLGENKEILPPQPIRDIQLRAFTHLGYSEVARALELLYENTSDGAVKALQVMGHGDEARSILGSNHADDEEMRGALMAAAYLEIPPSVGVASAKQLQPLRDWYGAKKITWEIVIRNVQNLLMPYDPKNKKDLSSNLMIDAFTRIYLSPKAVQFLEGLPTPYANIVPIDLDGHSQLARIMYEADYSLKSLSVMPELFQSIPGSLSRNEFQSKHGLLENRGKLDYRQWLEPKMVGMKVSPDHRVISFTSSQMRYFFNDDSEYWKRPPNEKLEHEFSAWCDHFMDHYNAYAGIVPAFHEIREAAKVLALAKWALAENIPLDLSGVTQEKWRTPEKVPAFYVLSEGIYTNGMRGTTRAFEGGVSFKTRGNWAQITPSTTTTTEETSAQLALSAQIGQKAVQAANADDLEKARYLSELSARALSGELSRGDLAGQNIALPAPKPVPVSPAAMQLQKEMIKATHRQIVEMSRSPGTDRQAAQTLDQIGHLYQQIQDHPVEASDYLKMLQTGRLAVPSPAPSPQPLAVAKPAVWAPCDDPAIQEHALPLTPQRREFLNDRLFEARERLKYINTALKNLIKINESQRAQLDEATRDISKAYDECVDRAWSVVFDLLINLPADKFLDNYEVAKDKLEDAMKYRTGMLTTPLDSATREQIESEIRQIQIGREHLDEIYQRSERLLHLFEGANYGYDIDKWNAEERDDYQKVKDGALMIGKIALDSPKLEGYLKTKDFFIGEKYYQVLAMGRMAYYAAGFFQDILAQKLAWEPLTGNLRNNLNTNIQAMEALRKKASETYREIGCIENALR